MAGGGALVADVDAELGERAADGAVGAFKERTRKLEVVFGGVKGTRPQHDPQDS